MVIAGLLFLGFITLNLIGNNRVYIILTVCTISLFGMFFSSLYILDERTRQYILKYSVNLLDKLKVRK